jgi:hypothetical protein
MKPGDGSFSIVAERTNPFAACKGFLMDASNLSRRQFVASASAGLLASSALADEPKLPQRPLGKTGARVPILGLGTVAVGNQTDQKTAAALIHKAIDLGVTYIDTAPPRTRIAFVTGLAGRSSISMAS